MKRSLILITDNSESYIHDVLCSLLPLKEDEELIIFDNHSEDKTVANILVTLDLLFWVDKEERYKFYINNKKEEVEKVKDKAISIARGKTFVIDKKEKFDLEEVLKCYD